MRIVLYGLFGGLNIGNESTLQALLAQIRASVPNPDLLAACANPDDVTARHGIPAVHISRADTLRHGSRSLARRAIGKIRRVVADVTDPIRVFKTMRGADMLLVAGTGLLEDGGWSAKWYFDILKWCLVARLRGSRVCFVSVGLGPILAPTSRIMTRASLRLADYVSYRDDFSFAYACSMAADTRSHHLVTDLAFGLLAPTRVAPDTAKRFTVGVGVIDYYGPQERIVKDASIHASYIARLTSVILKLVDKGHHVQMLHGDARYDPAVVEEVLERVREQGRADVMTHVSSRPLATVTDVMSAIAETDVVVASRYHNLIMSLLAAKPTISLSYHAKNDDLVKGFELGDYCQPIERFDPDVVVAHVETLLKNRQHISSAIGWQLASRRRMLDDQYRTLLAPLATPQPHVRAQPSER